MILKTTDLYPGLKNIQKFREKINLKKKREGNKIKGNEVQHAEIFVTKLCQRNPHLTQDR